MEKPPIMLTFYGDDFTGSTDVMESLSFNGIPTALFLQPPTAEEVQRFRLKNSLLSRDGKIKAVGVAGISRSLTPGQMDEQLPEAFEKMARIPSWYFHYKICSTFDSSPHIGNIGHAVEIALRYFPSPNIPLIVGIPVLNRFCVFGNLYARVDNLTYRIDRHPTMSKHPVTPMDESDLRIHLGKQTNQTIHLIDIIRLSRDKWRMEDYTNFSDQGGYILFDVLTMQQLEQIGGLLEKKRKMNHQLIVGSSGVEYALASYWQQNGLIEKPTLSQVTEKAGHYIIIAGSCSPGTAKQIEYGLKLGYEGIRMDPVKLIGNRSEAINHYTNACLEVLDNGNVPVLYSALGPDDPVIEATHKKLKESGRENDSTGVLLAGAQGIILKDIIDRTGKLRVTVAGGDTSGFVTKALGIYALEALIPIAPGAPLCVAHSHDKRYDGLELALKGGQNGNYRYFEYVHQGSSFI